MKFMLAGYGSRGDVEPCAAVGRELLRRGHDVRMAVSPDMIDFVGAAGLTAVAYGPDTREQMDAGAEFVRNVANPFSALPEVMEHLSQMWAEKTATLTSLAKDADLLLAGINEQELAAIVAEYCDIPLAALHFFPARVLSTGVLYSSMTKGVAEAHRRALGLPEATGRSRPALEIQAYDELCLPGPAAEWVESDGRRPFVGALTLGLPTDTDDEVLSWIAAGTPPICFGLGSTPISFPADMVAMISAACTQLGERALICSGPMTSPMSRVSTTSRLWTRCATRPSFRLAARSSTTAAPAARPRACGPEFPRWSCGSGSINRSGRQASNG